MCWKVTLFRDQVVIRYGVILVGWPADVPFWNLSNEGAAGVEQLRAGVGGASDEHLGQTYTVRRGEQVLMAMPRAAMLRGMVLSHVIHHRGQLTVYLRLLDIPVPALYGPSADEGRF